MEQPAQAHISAQDLYHRVLLVQMCQIQQLPALIPDLIQLMRESILDLWDMAVLLIQAFPLHLLVACRQVSWDHLASLHQLTLQDIYQQIQGIWLMDLGDPQLMLHGVIGLRIMAGIMAGANHRMLHLCMLPPGQPCTDLQQGCPQHMVSYLVIMHQGMQWVTVHLQLGLRHHLHLYRHRRRFQLGCRHRRLYHLCSLLVNHTMEPTWRLLLLSRIMELLLLLLLNWGIMELLLLLLLLLSNHIMELLLLLLYGSIMALLLLLLLLLLNRIMEQVPEQQVIQFRPPPMASEFQEMRIHLQDIVQEVRLARFQMWSVDSTSWHRLILPLAYFRHQHRSLQIVAHLLTRGVRQLLTSARLSQGHRSASAIPIIWCSR